MFETIRNFQRMGENVRYDARMVGRVQGVLQEGLIFGRSAPHITLVVQDLV